MARRPIATHRGGRIGWALGSLIPGGARPWGLFGPPIVALFCTSLVVAIHLHTSEGLATNLLDAIATPQMDRYYGAATFERHGPEAAFAALEHVWWMLLLVNPPLVALMERRRPDPNGPLAEADEGSPREPEAAPSGGAASGAGEQEE